MRYFLTYFLVFIIFSSCKKEEIKKSPLITKEVSFSIKNYLSLEDSLVLDFPISASPSFILDIAMTPDFIYTCSISRDYPIVKFDKSGNFLSYISKNGTGPGEFNLRPRKISASNNWIAVTDDISVYLFKDNKLMKKRNFKYKQKIYDLQFIKNLYVICAANSINNILELNNNLKIINSFIKVPAQASIFGIVPVPYWGVQIVNEILISHISYPIFITRSKILNNRVIPLESFRDLQFKHFMKVDSMITLESAQGKNIFNLDFYQSFSKILWISEKDKYFYGVYSFRKGKKKNKFTKKINYVFFIANRYNKTVEKIMEPVEANLTIIPLNDKIIQYKFEEYNKNIRAKLFFWTLNENKIDGFFN